MKKTIQVQVSEITADPKQGVSDKELMEKYGLSKDGLKSLFGKLLKIMSDGSTHTRIESE